jgi:ATP-dependent DNA ligase
MAWVFCRLRYRRDDRRVFLYAFDLLELDGRDLRREPIERRKVLLMRLLAKAPVGLQVNDHIDEPGDVAMHVSSGLRASYRSGSARPMSPAARGTGSRARTPSTQQ